MKATAVNIIKIYQIFISLFLKSILGVPLFCRYEITCSEYTKQQILKRGVLAGVFIGLQRVLKCNPLYNPKKSLGLKGYIK